MLEIILALPVLFTALLSPFLKPIRTIQFIIIFTGLGDAYIAAFSMFLSLFVLIYKCFIKTPIELNPTSIKYLKFSGFWLLYAFISIFWLTDYYRFLTEYIQLGLILSLLFLLIIVIKTIEDFDKIYIAFVWCGVLLSFKSVYDALNPEYVENNYFAFICMITCIAMPLSRLTKFSISNISLTVLIVSIGFFGINANDSRASTLLGVLTIGVRFFFLANIKYAYKIVTVILFLVFASLGSYLYYMSSEDNILRSVTDVERNYSNLERLALINQSYNIFIESPQGLGLGSSNNVFMNSMITGENYPHPHNALAHQAVELGLVGVLLYLFLFFNMYIVFKRMLKIRKENPKLLFLYNLCLLVPLNLFLFSFLDDMFFNGVFCFYCMLFFIYIFIIEKFSQPAFVKIVNAKIYR